MYKEICEKYTPEKDNLLYILHDIQDHHPQHYIPEEAVQVVAEYLNIPTNHIYGVLTFYTMYSTKPRGKNIIRLCESPPCYIKGSTNILRKLKMLLGVNTGETTKDGMFTLELCACLGVCGNAPVMMINEDVYGDLTEEKVEE
ncbi:MAG TPA: NADH-quinone oxidoreductase subunit NuoE, partial [Candidatus Syntrophosphaera sp.]|nr:NADH-quinone oxidoreductase subunit NuoE [Candidatus Syntrophosphaera sp.]